MRTAVHADDGRAIVRVHNRETGELAIQALPDTVTSRHGTPT